MRRRGISLGKPDLTLLAALSILCRCIASNFAIAGNASTLLMEMIHSDERNSSMSASPLNPVPLLDMKRQYEPLREKLLAAMAKVCDSGRYVLGPDCEELERAVAEYTGTRHAIACASGSDALLLALMALDVN